MHVARQITPHVAENVARHVVQSLATSGAIHRATCVEECAHNCFTCVQECVRASQWKRSHSRHMSTHIWTHSVTSLHILNIHDAGDTQTLSPHMCPSAFNLGHVARHVERFAS